MNQHEHLTRALQHLRGVLPMVSRRRPNGMSMRQADAVERSLITAEKFLRYAITEYESVERRKNQTARVEEASL